MTVQEEADRVMAGVHVHGPEILHGTSTPVATGVDPLLREAWDKQDAVEPAPKVMAAAPTFAVGDLVQHVASGERGLVLAVCLSCINPNHIGPKETHWTQAAAGVCIITPSGEYVISAGFGRDAVASVGELTAAVPIPPPGGGTAGV